MKILVVSAQESLSRLSPGCNESFECFANAVALLLSKRKKTLAFFFLSSVNIDIQSNPKCYKTLCHRDLQGYLQCYRTIRSQLSFPTSVNRILTVITSHQVIEPDCTW